MSSVRGSGVFNQMTFFSMLVPGLFAFSVLLLIAPRSMIEEWLGGAVILVPLSFSLGVVAKVLSGVVGKDASDRFAEYLVEKRTGELEGPLVDNFLSQVGDGDIWDESDLQTKLEELDPSESSPWSSLRSKPGKNFLGKIPMLEYDGEDNEGSDLSILYDHTLNTVWNNPTGFSRMDLSLVIMSRSLFLLSFILAAGVFVNYILIEMGMVVWNPAYTLLFGNNHFVFMAVVVVGLILNGLLFLKARNAFWDFLIKYAILDYVRLYRGPTVKEEPTGDGPRW